MPLYSSRILKHLFTIFVLTDIATFVLITKIDMLCEHVDENLQNTYKSEKVQKAVDIAEQLYNIPVIFLSF